MGYVEKHTDGISSKSSADQHTNNDGGRRLMENSLSESNFAKKRKIPIKIAIIYISIGSLWILFSDKILNNLFFDVSKISFFQTFKGLFFVGATGFLLYLLMRRYVSALAQSEMELYVREELFRTVQETSHEGFMIFTSIRNEQGKIIDFEVAYCNSEAARIMGFRVENIIGHSLLKAIPVFKENGLFEIFVNIVETGVSKHFEHSYRLNGCNLWFRNTAVKAGDGFAICFSDITDSKKALEELRQERDFSQSLVDNARTIIMLWAMDGTITLFNKYAEELTGYTAAEVIGKKWWEVFTPKEIKPAIPELLERFQQGEVIETGEHPWIAKDGGRIEILWTHTLSYDAEGKPLAIISMGIDITDRKRAEEIINHMAYHDPLTDLPNRALFNDRLKLALAHAKRNKQLLAVMFIDLDRFKLINDTLGHAMGDRVLKDVAQRLTECLREGDTVARIGGDEFILIFPQIAKEQDVAKIALKIIETMKRPFKVEMQEFHLTTSIGVAIYPHDGEDAETLVKNADSALYLAKEQGNTYQLYTPSMNDKAYERLNTEQALCKALENDEFEVHYQPQVNIITGQITGMEALVRWKHPEKGLVYPGDFIQIAEETGLIIPIGEWVLRTACLQSKAWQDAGYPPVTVVVNLSARQFLQQNLVETITRILQETGMDPKWLELEITEGVIMKDVDYTVKVLQELAKMGIRIAIDDFGTGYSSLNYLKRFPINTLKIDRSFIQGVVSDIQDAAIVSTIIVLARNLNLKVVAEGVETEEQYLFLRGKQCYDMQGYWFSRPVPAEEFEDLLKRQSFSRVVTMAEVAATEETNLLAET